MGVRPARACRRTRRSASSPAAKWETSPHLRPPASVCSSAWAGTSAGTASPGHRTFVCSSAHNATSRSTVRSACSASAFPRSWLPTGRDGLDAEALRAALAEGDGPTIVCAQAGEVNTGAFDPFDEIADAVAPHGAWLHVDGAFGLWAAASPNLRHLVHGVERADSWITDAHKWLNVPYDSALVLCADPEAHRAAMTISASYLIQDDSRNRSRPGRLGTGVLASRAWLRGLRGAALARSQRAFRARRANLRLRATFRRRHRRARRRRARRRRRPQPGPVPVRE